METDILIILTTGKEHQMELNGNWLCIEVQRDCDLLKVRSEGIVHYRCKDFTKKMIVFEV